MEIATIPADYREGYQRARLAAPDTAANYIAHTMIGDPEGDEVADLLSSMVPGERRRILRGCMDDDPGVIREAPQAVREFFEGVSKTPDWFQGAATVPGIRGFHANADLVLQAFVTGVLVEGFSTNISKSFVITGRLREQGVRRLKQNNRHVLDIFLPSGLERYADGWKLSVRIRLVHAQVRKLLSMSPSWDSDAQGTPISAAHMGLAAASFSARLLKHSETLGASFTEEERESFMLVWRYSAHLMGTPESILPRTEEEALRLYDIGMLCEPPPDFESIITANSLVNAVPLVAGITGRKEQQTIVRQVYGISRALIGDDMADQLNFPRHGNRGVLRLLRLQARWNRAMRRVFPRLSRSYHLNNFAQIIEAAAYDEEGISYAMPDHVNAERSQRW